MLIDSHAHLTGGDFTPEELPVLLQRATDAGVEAIVNICTDLPSLEWGRQLQARYSQIALTAAITPHDVAELGESAFASIAQAARAKQLVAIGETGLDYYYAHSPVALQKEHCIRYLALALACNLPVVIHCREAFDDLFVLLDQHYRLPGGAIAPGVLHCFTGTLEEAKRVLDCGFYISLSGIVTFKKSEWLREVAAYVPLDRLVIETDCPYLAPQSRRGKRNEPAYLVETATCLAAVKQLPLTEVALATRENAKTLFSI